jgi:alkanesulfonate monooxygenase SsuD/methylene tetrahydromethanopterin reductase-like flavin-dependent oxidoreductase (luciferase family)
MEFALFTDMQLPRPWKPDSEENLVREALEQGQLADRLGFDCIWAQEHHFLEEYSHSSAPEVFLGALSSTTRQIRLGHGISVMSPRINHPVRVAERVAMLDLLSGGRVEWGTGESGTRMELEPFHVPFVEKRSMWAEAVHEAARMMALSPYPGHEGKHFSMPARNVVPKPRQRPHPPLWAACSNRDSLRLAARMGVGALTFAFIDAAEARFWVEEYYDVFKRECRPLGLAVNPRVAMLTGFMCHADAEVAMARGLTGAHFFGFGLMHYWRDGDHTPGETQLWETFRARRAARPEGGDEHRRKAGMLGIGTPQTIDEEFRKFEEAGVDQLILLQQAGGYEHSAICESLELFAREVMPAFKERHASARRRREEELAPFIQAALDRRVADPAEAAEIVASYPRAWSAACPALAHAADRRPGASAFWRAQVLGLPRRREP